MRRAVVFGAAVVVIVVASAGACVTPPASLQAPVDYHSALQQLIDGPEAMTTATKAKLMQAAPQPLSSGMAGLTFGMSMQQVIDVWGRPNAVWVQSDGHVQLSMGYSTVAFVRDRLSDISVHSSDLDAFAIADGKIAMGRPCPPLREVFPDGLPVPDSNDPDVHELALKGDVILRVQEMDQQIISIEIGREN